MKIYVLNSAPRKNMNTAKMCEAFAAGAAEAGAEVETVRLYDLDYKGCHSCMACKRRGAKTYGRCVWPDGITQLLADVSNADGVAFASPIYLFEPNAAMRAFVERLVYPYRSFAAEPEQLAPKRFETAALYTMNVPEPVFKEVCLSGGHGTVESFEYWIADTFSAPERVCAFNTWQYDDYGKYVADLWDLDDKARHRDDEFPKELEAARTAGANMVARIAAK